MLRIFGGGSLTSTRKTLHCIVAPNETRKVRLRKYNQVKRASNLELNHLSGWSVVVLISRVIQRNATLIQNVSLVVGIYINFDGLSLNLMNIDK